MFAFLTRWQCSPRYTSLVSCIGICNQSRAFDTNHLSAEDHKILVELACAATLSPAYNPTLFRKLVPQTDKRATVVFIVCGGFKISLEELAEYRTILEGDEKSKADWDVACNGEEWKIAKS